MPAADTSAHWHCSPRDADAHYNRARALHSPAQPTQDQVDPALRTLNTAWVVAPQRLGLLHNRAVLLQRCHRHAEALAVHEQAAAPGLDALDEHYNRGSTLQSLGRHDETIAAYRQTLARDDTQARALYDQGHPLVLVPSMAWHGTRPFEDDAERLTIAFDVISA